MEAEPTVFQIDKWLVESSGYGPVYEASRLGDDVQFLLTIKDRRTESMVGGGVEKLMKLSHTAVVPVVEQWFTLLHTNVLQQHVVAPTYDGDLVSFRERRNTPLTREEMQTYLEHLGSALDFVETNYFSSTTFNPLTIRYEQATPQSLKFLVSNVGMHREESYPEGPFAAPMGVGPMWSLCVSACWAVMSEGEIGRFLAGFRKDDTPLRMVSIVRDRLGKTFSSFIAIVLQQEGGIKFTGQDLLRATSVDELLQDTTPCKSCCKVSEYRCTACDPQCHLCASEACFTFTHPVTKPHKSCLVTPDGVLVKNPYTTQRPKVFTGCEKPSPLRLQVESMLRLGP